MPKIGFKHLEESKEKMSKAHLGKTAWNKGKKRWWITPNSFAKGHIPWNKNLKGFLAKEKHYLFGKHRSELEKRKMSEANKGKHLSPATEFKKGHPALATAFKKGHKVGFQKGEKHLFWNDGSSFEPYGTEFNEKLREQIRK